MVTIQTVELDRADNPAPRGDFLGPYVDWDSAGFQHEIFVRQAGTQTDDSTTLHYTKKNAQGQVVDQGTIQPPADVNGHAMKYVNIGAPLIIIPPASSVGSFIVPFSAHGAGPNGGRRILRDYHVIPDVFAPHPRGEQANERFDVTLPTGGDPNPDPGGSGVTPADIEAIATAVLGKVVQAFGGDIRRGIHDKAKQAVEETVAEQGVLTLHLTRAGGDAGYYQQQINTAYTGAKGAIHDSSGFGGGHSAQAPTEAPQAGLPDTFTERSGMSGIYEGEDQ